MSTRSGRALGTAILGAGLVVLSCSANRGGASVELGADASVSTATTGVLVESSAAAIRLAELGARFRALSPPVATRFESDATADVHAVLPPEALLGVARAAHVALPLRANEAVTLSDDTSHLAVRFTLDNVQNAHIEVSGGVALYRGALAGADVVHRVHAEGTEDFVFFETRPAREELVYWVDVSGVPGLRFVSNTLEFLAEAGTPVLRVAPPYVVDASGKVHQATLAVTGCTYDASSAGPWGRPVTHPGATRCRVGVRWAGIEYPAMVDPAWGATGSMAGARARHTASTLPSGKILVAGGRDNGIGTLSSAELYDPAGSGGTGTFAATGSMGTARKYHTASVLPSGKVLVVGGENASAVMLASAELYDPAGNAGAGTFAPTGSMASAREDHAASVLPSGKVLLVGGYKNVNPFFLASAELFDPAGNAGTGAFVATGSMGTTRRQPSATVLSSGKVLVVGGSSFGVGTVASAEVFDPAGNSGAGSFVDTASMGTARILHTATALASGKVLIAGGKDSGGWLAAAEVFDPAGNSGAGTFAATGSMAAPRGYHTASLLPSGLVVVAGGQASAYLASAEVFDPAANAGAGAFVATAAMASARAEQTANTLSSGRIVAVGGNSSAGCLASAELYGGALGDPCSLNAYCLSGFCASGVCCDAVCNGGSCQRCDLNGKEGKCTIAPSGNPGAKPPCAFPLACDGVNPTCPPSCATDASCAPSYYCGSNGTCQPRKAQGVACNPQSDCKEAGCQECTAGTCADGVCCDRACSGQCEACDAVAGVCSPIAGKPHGARPDCPSGKACGTSTNACEVGAGTCDGDHTAKAADGTTKDCAPYKCESSGTCRPSCASVNDCVAPTICDSTGKCVGPAAAGNDGGCAIAEAAGAAGDESSRLAWLAVAAGLVLAQLWRRRRAGGATLSKRFSEEEINRFREGGRG